MIRVALDSNILVYLTGVSRSHADDPKISHIRALHARLDQVTELVIPVQALGELAVVMTRAGSSRADARAVVEDLLRDVASAPTDATTMAAAIALADEHKLQLWDSVILSGAAQVGCAMLLSEDMQHGFAWRGLTVVNPFADIVHPKLAALMG